MLNVEFNCKLEFNIEKYDTNKNQSKYYALKNRVI